MNNKILNKKTKKKTGYNDHAKESLVINAQTIFTLANFLTSLRIMLAPFILLALLRYNYGAAFLLFTIASFTDIFDGKIARIMKSQSKFGAILDPIADVTLMTFTIIGLSLMTDFPLWFVAIVLLREIIIIAGGILCLATNNVYLAKADVVGKISRFLQVASLFVFLFSLYDNMVLNLAYAIIYIATLSTLVSAVIYISRIRIIFSKKGKE